MSLPAFTSPALPAVSGSGLERAARLLRALGPAATAVWSELSPDEADQLGSAMEAMPAGQVPEDTDTLAAALRQAGQSRPQSSSSVWRRLSQVDTARLARQLKSEHPQVLAVILSRLQPDAAAETVRALPRPVATDTLRRLLHLGRVRRDALETLERLAGEHLLAALESRASEGDESVARIFDRLGSSQEAGLLAALDEAEPGSAARIRALMFTFDDLAALGPAAVQTILSSIDRSRLAVALKGAKAPVREIFLRNMTRRAGELLTAEIDGMGPARRGDIEAARQEITTIARSLARRGDILPQQDDADELVE